MPGEHLVVDWADAPGAQMFCAVLAWSRYRFVRFAADQRRETTLALLAECLAEVGGAPAVVLADRMGCLRAGVVANVVVPHPEYVRFATHYGFRPDFCKAADPESKGVVEALVRYAKQDPVIPSDGWASPAAANADARVWCAEVNRRVHAETAAVPAERLAAERGLLRRLPSLAAPCPAARSGRSTGCRRCGSARRASRRPRSWSASASRSPTARWCCATARAVVRHRCVAPGEVALDDAHYGGAVERPVRAVRPRSDAERAFLGLGSVAERFLRAAAAAGTTRLAGELVGILALEAAWGRPGVVAALERAVLFRRFTAADVGAILAAGTGWPTPTGSGEPLALDLLAVPTRPLSDYALAALA